MDFLFALRKAKEKKQNIVIPDIKCFSPKEGDLMQGRNPVDYALALCKAGAPVLSVVTEEKEFHGSLAMLRAIAAAVDVPILRKDFIHTKQDLEETKAAGASAILLMCSCLEEEELTTLYHQALALGLDPFVETHRPEDFELVKKLGAELIGINNRDILVLERDEGNVSHTLQLAQLAPQTAFLVTESSIQNPQQVRLALDAGADAALVGTAILQAPYTGSFYRMLCRRVSLKVCGLMTEEDVALCVELGVERIGLVTEYPVDVPWNLTAEQAHRLRQVIPSGYAACLVSGGSNEKLMSLAERIQPDYLQLHYRESGNQAAELARMLASRGIGVIKTIPVTAEEKREQFHTDSLEDILLQMDASPVAELLVDARCSANASRQDLFLDIELAQQVLRLSKKPVVLAGGLEAESLPALLAETSCRAVDIMTGSENGPGHKSREKIEAILAALDAN